MHRYTEKAPNDDLADRLFLAIDNLLANDRHLLKVLAHERTICATLACYLKPLFPSWHVDVEYNRQEVISKRVGSGGEGERIVIPDLIIHKRGTQNNYLVLEMKIGSSNDPDTDDVINLEDVMMTHNYKYAVFVRLDFRYGVSCMHWVAPR